MPTAHEVTPIDKDLTGLPLPVLMTGTDFSFQGANLPHDFHHTFHPRRSPELGYNPETGRMFPIGDARRIAGTALRLSRGQDTPVWLHRRYHDIFTGPPLPQTPTDQFTSVVLVCAGIVPREAIDLYAPGSYRKVEMTPKAHEFVRQRTMLEGEPGRKWVKRNRIGMFLADYALEHSLTDVLGEEEVRRKVHELLRPRSEQQKLLAAKFILTHAVDASVADTVPIYQEAKTAGLIGHPKRTLVDVVFKYFTEDRFPDYYDTLERRALEVA